LNKNEENPFSKSKDGFFCVKCNLFEVAKAIFIIPHSKPKYDDFIKFGIRKRNLYIRNSLM